MDAALKTIHRDGELLGGANAVEGAENSAVFVYMLGSCRNRQAAVVWEESKKRKGLDETSIGKRIEWMLAGKNHHAARPWAAQSDPRP
jgi:hypothetical protein